MGHRKEISGKAVGHGNTFSIARWENDTCLDASVFGLTISARSYVEFRILQKVGNRKACDKPYRQIAGQGNA